MVAVGGGNFAPDVNSVLWYLWSMGPVKGIYFHCEKSGGRYFGREITLLSVLRTEFVVSPS